MILRSFDCFNNFARIKGNFDEIQQFTNNGSDPSLPVVGFFSIGAKQDFLAFFFQDGQFALHGNGQTIPLGKTSRIRRTVGDSGIVTLTVDVGLHQVSTLSYTPSTCRKHFDADPTPFIEDEDFDFSLFITNVVQHPLRLAILADQWKKGGIH